MQIPGLRGLSPGNLVVQAGKKFSRDDMTTFAAALSYQTLFSLFPFFIFLLALVGFFHVGDFIVWLRQQAATVVPDQAMSQVNQVLDSLQQQQGGLLSIGAVVALWSASAGVRACMHALNAAYEVEEGRPTWKVYLLSIVYTIATAALLIVAAAFLLIGPQAMLWIAQHVGFEQLFVTLWAWLRWPLAAMFLILSVALIYYSAPDAQQKFRFITPGAVLAVLVWIAASFAFKLYVQNFGSYDKMYGSIGAIIVLLLYFYISALVMLFGAEINAVIEHHAPEGKNPGQKTLH